MSYKLDKESKENYHITTSSCIAVGIRWVSHAECSVLVGPDLVHSACLQPLLLQPHTQAEDLHFGRKQRGHAAVHVLSVVTQCIHIGCALQQDVASYK